MDDDDLANVLRSSGNTGLPSFYSPANNAGPAAEDPFANPFANPFASGSTQPTELGDTGQSSSSIDGSQREESPYVAQLQREGVINPPVDAGVSAGGFAAEPYNFDTTGFGTTSVSQGFGSASTSALDDPYAAADPFAPSPFAPSPFASSPLRSPQSQMTQSMYSPAALHASQLQSTFRSPTRTKPGSDILGLLDDDDGSSDLKKAFVAGSSRRGSNQVDDLVAASPDKAKAGTSKPAPYVFKPGGGGGRRKPVGISVDSVRQERERERLAREQEAQAKALKEKEEQERSKAEQEKAVDLQETAKAQQSPSRQEVSTSKMSADDGEDEGLLADRDAALEGAQKKETVSSVPAEALVGDRETAASSGSLPSQPGVRNNREEPMIQPLPLADAETTNQISEGHTDGPVIPPTVAAQILSAEHPDVASRNVAEVLAEGSPVSASHQESDLVLAAQQADLPDPASVPLPASRIDSPVQKSGSTSRVASPLDNREHAGGNSFANLTLGGASFTADEAVSQDVAPHPGRHPSWGRAFDDNQSASNGRTIAETLPSHPAESSEWTSSGAPIASPLDAGFSSPSNAWAPVGNQYDNTQHYSDMTGVSMTDDFPPTSPLSSATRSPTRNRILSQPLFTINISDPTKVGDPVRGYIVYTVTTRTTSPHFKRGEFSVLRRFSDFLWLFEAVSNNNPGVIVPPMPDKHAFGRFEEQFVETRRAALERTLGKMANHPVLSLDPDLKLFLSSDTFSIDVKNRRQELVQEKQGMLASIGGTIGGPRFTEQDDWFDKQKSALDALEVQIKALTKCLEVSSKQRLDLALSVTTLADGLKALSECDLSYELAQLLETFSELSAKERELEEEQAKMDVVRLLNLADEHLRLIGSVRAAFASRVKSYFNWQNAESEARRMKVQYERDRAKRGGKYAPDKVGAALPDISQAERRALDAHSDFDAVSRLVKLEFARFEQERVEDYKQALEGYIDDALDGQRRLIAEWEAYHKSLTTAVTQHREIRTRS